MLYDVGFNKSDIARMFNICRRTLLRRLQQWDLVLVRHMTISDEQLDAHVTEICASHPHTGIAMLQVYVTSLSVFYSCVYHGYHMYHVPSSLI